MPVVFALIFAVVVLAVCLIGFLWSLAFLLPFYACIGVAAYLLWRMDRKQKDVAAAVERDAEQQRVFNEQEMNAWRAALQNDRRNAARRAKALGDLDSTRDPPPHE